MTPLDKFLLTAKAINIGNAKKDSDNDWDAQIDRETYENPVPGVAWTFIGVKDTQPAWHGGGGVTGPLRTAVYQSERGVVLHFFDPNTKFRHILSYNDNVFTQFEDEDEALRYLSQVYGIKNPKAIGMPVLGEET